LNNKPVDYLTAIAYAANYKYEKILLGYQEVEIHEIVETISFIYQKPLAEVYTDVETLYQSTIHK